MPVSPVQHQPPAGLTSFATTQDTQPTQRRSVSPSDSMASSAMPGCGSPWKSLCQTLRDCWWSGGGNAAPRTGGPASATHLLQPDDNAVYHLQENWARFFAGQFTSAVFNPPGESEAINAARFLEQKKEYVSQLREAVKGSPHIHVPFHDLPECRAGALSQRLKTRGDGSRPMHVSLLLAKLTLKELRDALLGEPEMERTVHIDFGRMPAVAEEATSHSDARLRHEDGFFTLPLKETLDAMAHFGTLNPEVGGEDEAGIRNTPGLTVSADLSGLKIKDPDDMPHLHNLIMRSTIADLHINLSLIEPNQQAEAWRLLAKMLHAEGAKHLLHLTVDMPAKEASAKLAAGELAHALRDPRCRLQTLTLNGGDWNEAAKKELMDAATDPRDGYAPITVRIAA